MCEFGATDEGVSERKNRVYVHVGDRYHPVDSLRTHRGAICVTYLTRRTQHHHTREYRPPKIHYIPLSIATLISRDEYCMLRNEVMEEIMSEHNALRK